jgi:hypothetical protein
MILYQNDPIIARGRYELHSVRYSVKDNFDRLVKLGSDANCDFAKNIAVGYEKGEASIIIINDTGAHDEGVLETYRAGELELCRYQGEHDFHPLLWVNKHVALVVSTVLRSEVLDDNTVVIGWL